MFKFRQNQYIYLAVILFILLCRVSPCLAEFTIEDEKKVGKEFYDKMEESQLIYWNKDINSYINKVGDLILSQTQKAPFEFHFFIVNSNAINAFATPGGYIYINKGLITSAENEAEMAAVIAHELGHANGRHVASIVEKSKKLNVATLAAIIAGAFLGGGGEATAAIAAFALAGSSTMTLKYMREHEEEADRMGMGYLISAGYYPEAMIDFLKIMKQNEFISKTMPSYLLTHPGTDDRIYYMDGLILTQYSQKSKKGKKNIIGNFRRMQALVPSDSSEDLNRKCRQLENSLKTDPNNVDSLYILAFYEDQLGQVSAALDHYQKALKLSPRDEDVLKNMGLLYLKTAKAELAQEYLLKAESINPKNSEVAYALGKTYLYQENYQKALNYFLKLDERSLNDDDMNYQIAMAYGKLNNQGESHYYFGLHFKKERKRESALFHFKEALNYFPKDSSRSIAINKAIKELEASPRFNSPMGPPRR
jgi:beta-barrel assembly-enhancing protease